jgi:hypothetical protein
VASLPVIAALDQSLNVLRGAAGLLACVLAHAIRHPASDATCRRGSAGRLTHDTAGPEKAPTDQTEMCASLVVLPGQNDD